MKKHLRVLTCLVLCLFTSLFLVACNEQMSDKDSLPEQEQFELVQPSELGKRNHWELAKTFDLLSRQFIQAAAKGDQESLATMIHPDKNFSLPLDISTEITHLKQQTVILYQNDEYISIMQVGTKSTPYYYLHIFFQPVGGDWKIIDVQLDA